MALGVSTIGLLLFVWAILLVLLVVWLWRRGGIPRDHADPHAEVAAVERRGGWDRRHENLGPPPGVPDRRRGLDRRASAPISPFA